MLSLNAKTYFICKFCNKVLANSVILPCNCTICDEHVNEFYTNENRTCCVLCGKETKITRDNVKKDTFSDYIVENNLYLTNNELRLKKNSDLQIEKVNTAFNEFIKRSAELEVIQYDQFFDLKTKVDIRREELKMKIDEIAEKMIDQIKISEEKHKQKMNNNQMEISQNEVEALNRSLSENLRMPILDIDEIKRVELKQDEITSELDKKIGVLKGLESELKEIEFKSSVNFDASLFGMLDLNDDLNDCFNLISCSWDKAIRIWNLKSKQCVRELNRHKSAVFCVKVLGENIIASCGSLGSIIIWDLKTGEYLYDLNGHIGNVPCLVFSNDLLISGGSDRKIKIWDIYQVRCIKTLHGHLDSVMSLEILPDGNLISGSEDNNIKLWEMPSGNYKATNRIHKGNVLCFKTINNEEIASGSGDRTIQIWNIQTGQSIKTLNGHTDWVSGLELTKNGSNLVSCSHDHSIRLWDLINGTCIKILKGHTRGVNSIILNKNGRLLSCSSDRTIKIWNLELGTCVDLSSDDHNDLIWKLELYKPVKMD